MRPLAARAPQRRSPSGAAQTTSRRPLTVRAAVHARWCLDVRYGCKGEATALLQEWVAQVGSRAGLTPQNTRLSSGCVGVPESRLEMEVTFDSMAGWEAFLAAVPRAEHTAWSQRMRSVVVDGSPVWQVHNSVPLLPPGQSAAGGATSVSSSSSSSSNAAAPAAAASVSGAGQKQLVIADQLRAEDVAAWQHLAGGGGGAQPQQQQQQPPQQQPLGAGDGGKVQLDWKGEPMTVNPGDKLPFKFL